MLSSVYIHIPFCTKICSYCDFCKMLYNKEFVTSYLENLQNEIDEYYSGEEIKTLYIGGGTPSCLDVSDLSKLFMILKTFKRSNDIEYSFECNILDINVPLLTILKNNGVNRLSIGIESFNKEKLITMQRTSLQDHEIKEKIELCRRFGFNNINLDLIYGFKDERLSVLKNDLNKILSLKPEHISTYSLIIEDNTILGIKKYRPLDDDSNARMYEYIVKKLKKYGYHHYEISNFALPNYESKHNINYWLNNEYYGFGLGASGYVEGFRYDNTKSLTSYNEGTYKIKTEIISPKEKMDLEIMLGLRLTKGINIKDFYNKYGVNIQNVYELDRLLKNKDLIYKKGYLYIPSDKLYIMDEILLKLL